MVGQEEEGLVLLVLGHAEELLRQFPCSVEFRAEQVKVTQPEKRWKDLWRFPYLLTELLRPGVNLSHFWGRPALGGDQRWAEGGLQDQLLLRALRGVRERVEHLQAPGKMRDCFHMGRALAG